VECVTNFKVRRRTGQPLLSDTVWIRRLKLFGHVARADKSQDHFRALQACISLAPRNWRRRPGRPRHTWLRVGVNCTRHAGSLQDMVCLVLLWCIVMAKPDETKRNWLKFCLKLHVLSWRTLNIEIITLPMDMTHAGNTMHKRIWSKYDILWCQNQWTYFLIAIWRWS